MELMIVIVIIGILSAVGMVMFGGQAEKAKIAVAKSNHKSATKYIKIEVMKCDLGETSVMEGNLTCAGRSHQKVIDAIVKSFGKGSQSHFKNPYGKGSQAANDTAVTDGGGWSNDYDIGYIRLQVWADYVIGVGTCYAIPCNDSKNKFLDILRVLDTPK